MKASRQTGAVASDPGHESERDQRLAAALEDYLTQLEQGIDCPPEELATRYPEFATELDSYLKSLRFLHQQTQASRSPTAPPREDSPALAASEDLGSLGDYRLIREIGRGGMGIVYEAWQFSLDRRVALKVLPFAAVLDHRQIARFRHEAQAAAQLHHPHIVPVYAVGEQSGVHYFAMQYVDGQSLAEVVHEFRGRRKPKTPPEEDRGDTLRGDDRETRADTDSARSRTPGHGSRRFRDIAQLFEKLAQALHHAHEMGIVHRDIKPSNLLVDARGEPWVTDFGLARMQTELDVTGTGDVLGTLRYMSPEQAAGQNGRIDSRTDVYSLGITFYELLTLQEAFPGDERHDVLRRIAEVEPVRPRRLDAAIPKDLETIVLKAIEKDRDDRYESAAQFAADLNRYLRGQPPQARRAGPIDRAAKWVRRHRAVAATAAAAMCIVAAVSLFAVVRLAAAQRRTDLALAEVRRQAAVAEQNFQQAREVVAQLGVQVADRLAPLAGSEELRKEILVSTLNYYEAFTKQAGHDPTLAVELVDSHYRCGLAAARLGRVPRAIYHYQSTIELAAAEPSASRLHPGVALAHNNLGLLRVAQGDFPAAERHYQTALEIFSEQLADRPESLSNVNQFVEVISNFAMLFDARGESAAAVKLLAGAATRLEDAGPALLNEPRYARNLALVRNNLAYVQRRENPLAAEANVRQALATLQRVAERLPVEIDFESDLALFGNNLATILIQRGDLAGAVQEYRAAIVRQERLKRRSPHVPRHRSDLAIAWNNLGVAYCRQGQDALADEAFAAAESEFVQLVTDYPRELRFQSGLAGLLNNQGLALTKAGRTDASLAAFDAAIELQTEVARQLSEAVAVQDQLLRIEANRESALKSAAGSEARTTDAPSFREPAADGSSDLGTSPEDPPLSTTATIGSERLLPASAAGGDGL